MMAPKVINHPSPATKKPPDESGGSYSIAMKNGSGLSSSPLHNLMLFRFFSVFLLELVDPACGINHHIFTSKERV